MTTYNTGNPLGSPDPRDLYDNAENLDEAVNSDAETWQDRLGITRPTFKRLERDYPNAGLDADRAEAAAAVAEAGATKAEAEADRAEDFALAVQQGAGIFDTVNQGLSGTAEEDFFFVAGEEDSFLVMYRHDPGNVATERGRSPNTESVRDAINLAQSYTGIFDYFDLDHLVLVPDENGETRVVEWYSASDAGNGFVDELRVQVQPAQDMAATMSTIFDYFDARFIRIVPDENGETRVVEIVPIDGDYQSFPESGAPPAPTVDEFVVFLAAGQSNMDGRAGDSPVPTPSAGTAYAWDGAALEAVPGPETNDNCLPAFCEAFTAATGKGVIVVKYAVGGSAMAPGAAVSNGYWGAAGSHREPAVAALNACLSHLRANDYAYQFGGVLWSQGERDAQAIDTSDIVIADYNAAFDDLLAYFRAELGSWWPMYLIRTGQLTTGDTPGWQAIRDAQDDRVATDQFVRMAYTAAFRFPSLSLMIDTIHYNQEGQNRIGAVLGRAAALSSMTAIQVA